MNKLILSRPAAVAALCAFWLLLVLAGLRQVWRYGGTPGEAAVAPGRWPDMASLPDAQGGATLLMVIHPHCPCSRASLAELAHLMARSQSRVRATVAFVRYPGVSEQWVQSDTWRQAAAIPGVHVVSDQGGALARRFGARTSGQTYLYDRDGRLLFSGGLTSARGHEGDNVGLSAALTLVRGQAPAQTRTPVFGCSLFPNSPPWEKERSCPPHQHQK